MTDLTHPDLYLVDGLRRFIDLFERDPSAACAFIESASDFMFDEQSDLDGEFVPLDQQLAVLKQASADAKSEILRKTLISLSSESDSHRDLSELIAKRSAVKPDETSQKLKTEDLTVKYGFSGKSKAELDELWSQIWQSRQTDKQPMALSLEQYYAWSAAYEGKTYYEFKRTEILEKLSERKLEASVARLLVSHILAAVDAIQKLDNADFSLMVPAQFRRPFMETHMNVSLGNYATAIILCGAVIERSLQDLIPSAEFGAKLIKEAEAEGILKDVRPGWAFDISRLRNEVIHGKRSFDSITPDEAWGTVVKTRKLVHGMYKERLESD
jgi:hypothetical protein